MTSESAPRTLLQEVSSEVEHPAKKLTFSDRIEDRFLSSRENARIRHYVRTTLFGMILYNLFIASDAFIMKDIFMFSLLVHAVVTLIASVIIYLVYRRAVSPNAIVVSLTLVLANTLINLRLSHSPDAHFLFFIVPVIFLYGNVILPFPFRLALQFSTLCVLATILTIATQPVFSPGAKVLMSIVQLNVAAFTLVATYRSETFERRSYLLNLRETLRGEALIEQNRELSQLSETDSLTGVANRRVFDRTLENLWTEHLLSRTPIALLMIDIDHFKQLNDTHGHGNGDLCLKKTADRLRALMHAHQSLARYGGEEFAVLLEGEGARKAAIVAERLRAEIEAMPVPITGSDGRPHRITISIGCATVIPRPGLLPAELFVEADKALYAAKRAGRNRVQAHSMEPIVPTAHAAVHTTPLVTSDSLSRN